MIEIFIYSNTLVHKMYIKYTTFRKHREAVRYLLRGNTEKFHKFVKPNSFKKRETILVKYKEMYSHHDKDNALFKMKTSGANNLSFQLFIFSKHPS